MGRLSVRKRRKVSFSSGCAVAGGRVSKVLSRCEHLRQPIIIVMSCDNYEMTGWGLLITINSCWRSCHWLKCVRGAANALVCRCRHRINHACFRLETATLLMHFIRRMRIERRFNWVRWTCSLKINHNSSTSLGLPHSHVVPLQPHSPVDNLIIHHYVQTNYPFENSFC